jgi:hypothetical protein
MPDPKLANFRDFYLQEIWRFLSVFRPIFIRMMDHWQASKKK